QNYRSIGGAPSGRGVRVDLGPMTFLLGANGAGKSTLVDAIEFLARLGHGAEDLYALLAPLRGYDNVVHRQEVARKMRFGLSIHEERISYEVTLAGGSDCRVVAEWAHMDGGRKLLEQRGDRVWLWDEREQAERDYGVNGTRTSLAGIIRDPARFP